MKKIVFATIILSIIILTFTFQVRAEDSVKVGVTLSLTGNTAFWGQNAQKGISLGLDEVNKSGGVNGKPLEAIFEDFGDFNLKSVATSAQKFISVDKVKAIITQWSEDSEVVWPIASKKSIPTLSISAGAKDLTSVKKLLFRVWPSDEKFVDATVKYALDNGKQKAAIIFAQTTYFTSLETITESAWKNSTHQESLVYEVTPTQNDFKTIISQIKSAGVDVIFMHLPFDMEGLFLKQAYELGIRCLKIGTQHSDDSSVLLTAGQAAEGLIFPQYAAPSASFLGKFREKYNMDPGVPSEFAYDAIKILARIMNEYGIDSESIKTGLLNVRDYDGASGKITIDKNGNRISKEVELRIIENGKGVILKAA